MVNAWSPSRQLGHKWRLSFLLVLLMSCGVSPAQNQKSKAVCTVFKISGLAGTESAKNVTAALLLSERVLQERLGQQASEKELADISSALTLIRKLRFNVADD